MTPGARIGPYEILSQLGRGGMGVVYRARDTRLRRDVAVKILPEDFSHDADRLARFEREAQVLASLNHQNIAHIYGLEEAGSSCIVMELVEGDTLADLIRRGPVPLAETLSMARQLADALEAAHQQSVVHRDLKPANIKITPDGKLKVLDFGLAKALGPKVDSDATRMSTVMEATHAGVILGTAPYMSPEQTRGKDVDARTDIWAYGCVLYELLTGQRAFTGETASDVLAMILTSHPDWERLPHDTPDSVRMLLALTLNKDPKQRLQHIGDARPYLTTDVLLDTRRPGPGAIEPPRPNRSRAVLASVAAAAVVMAGAALLYFRPSRAQTVAPSAASAASNAVARDAVAPASPAAITATTPRDAPTPSPSLAAEAWERVKGSGNRAGLEAFISAYGDTEYAKSARVELALLPRSVAPTSDGAAIPAPDHAATASGPHPGQEWTSPKDGQRYVWIPPGDFRMGCSPGDTLCLGDERPPKSVVISKGFWLAQTPVTIAAWQRYSAATGASPLATSDIFGRRVNGAAGDPSVPVVVLRWEQARTFCQWTGGRLPTEEEWEYAARAGTIGPQYGPLDEIAWYADNAGRQRIDASSFRSLSREAIEKALFENGNGPHPVARKQPNAWNLYDMLGNVAQWTSDQYDSPNLMAAPPPGWTRNEDVMVTRGGSWFSSAWQMRVSARIPLRKTDVRSGVGFRCTVDRP